MASITLSPELSARVEQTARQRGTSVEAMIEEWLGPSFAIEEVAAVKEALEASQQGRHRSATEFFSEHRKKYPEAR